MARRGIRVCDLRDKALLKEKLETMMLHHNALLKGLGAEELDVGTLYSDLLEISDEVLSYAGVVWKVLDEARRDNKKILL